MALSFVMLDMLSEINVLLGFETLKLGADSAVAEEFVEESDAIEIRERKKRRR